MRLLNDIRTMAAPARGFGLKTTGSLAPLWALVVASQLFLAAPAVVEAQVRDRRPVVPEVGEEVRVVRRGERGAVHGPFVEATRQEIVLGTDLEAGTLRIPRETITGMSVQRGYRSQRLKGSLIGIGAGIVGGIIIGQRVDDFGGGTAGAVGISVGAALPLGFLIGWLFRSPEWDGIDLAALVPDLSPRLSRP